MPPKGKVASRPKDPEAKEAPPPPTPSTVNERSQQRFEQTNPFHKTLQEVGPSGLSPADRNAWASAHLVRAAAAAASSSARGSSSSKLGNKAQRDLWRHVNEASLPLRTLKRRTHPQQQQQQGLPDNSTAPTQWGRDRPGRDVGDYTPEQFDQRTAQRVHLTALEIAHRAFLDKRDRARRGVVDPDTGEATKVGEEDIAEEALRRREMAHLRADLYGDRSNPYAQDPAWDDVVPIPQEDPEGALAAIAYPEDYAEAIGYLRAVMVKQECSPRCLKLTEHIISMNPAHYTVWLYRFSIIAALDLSIPDEIKWLNGVALNYLKNYQIWHHRQQLMDQYYPQIRDDPSKVVEVAASETEFLTAMLAEDTKNYHVWSYRQYLVRKLGNWSAAELAATEKLVDDDVRNNSAWSHRFFLVFSDPGYATPGSHSTERDEAVPAEIVDREIAYAQGKIRLAPQNQSPWNYLKGVLTKGGRPTASVQGFVEEFVENIGEGEDKEVVKSTHALDLLAEIYAENGEKDKAEVCLRRLAEKWDRIRAGYWEFRRLGLSSK